MSSPSHDKLAANIPITSEQDMLEAMQGLKSLPVVDDTNKVVSSISEKDFLLRLKADSFLELMLRLIEDPMRAWGRGGSLTASYGPIMQHYSQPSK